MNRMEAFNKAFESRDKYKSIERSSHSLSFHDREDIRRRLALDSDSEDMSSFRSSRKSSFMNRLQSGQSLQICFMNETTNDSTRQQNNYHNEDNTLVDNTRKTAFLDNSYSITSDTSPLKTSPNNNSSLNISDSLSESMNISKSNINCPNHLFTPLDSGSLDLQKCDLFSVIQKPSKKELFSEYHSRLHTEARLALAQVKKIVKKQIELERDKSESRSSVYNLINIPIKYKLRKNKLSESLLKNLNVSQLQLIVNDMYSQIESLNTELMQILVRRDELYMEQDSVLVDVEDLTMFLFSKQ